MSPDQILALKKQGASNDAIIAQQAMDIANEQGVDMGAAMQEARRNIQALDAAVIAGDTAQEGVGLGSPTLSKRIPQSERVSSAYFRPLDELLTRLEMEEGTVPPAKPVRSPIIDPLAKESAAARAALPPLAGLQQDSLATQALMDMPSPSIGTPNLRDIDIQARAGLPPLAGMQQAKLASDALMDMPTGMSPAQRYAMRFGDTGAYDITGGDLRNIDTAARSALNDLSLSNFRQIEGGLNDTSISDTPSYQRLRDLGYTDTQANAIARQDLNLDIDSAMEVTAKPKPTATALPSESQPFGGGARNTAEYTDTLNTKMQNDRVNTRIKIRDDAMENTQGNVQWQLEQLKKDPMTRYLSPDALLNLAKANASEFNRDATIANKEDKATIADNPTNNEILNGQLAKNKVDNIIKAYRKYGIPLGELEDFEGQSVTDYINNKTDLKTVDTITSKANTNAFKGFVDSNISESFQDDIKQIETDTAKEQKKSADQIIIDNAKAAKDIADAKAATNPTPANTAAANKANDAYNSAVTTSGVMTTTPATTTPAATGAMGTGTGLGTGAMGGEFNQFVSPQSRADIVSFLEGQRGGLGEVLARVSANIPVTAMTPEYEQFLQYQALPQLEQAYLASGGGMAGTQFAPQEGSPYSGFEQFLMGGGGRLSSQGYQDLIGDVSTALQSQAPTDRQAYLQSLYASPEAQRQLYAQGLRAGASGAVGDVIDRMVNRRFRQQQFQSPTSAFLPTALSPRTAFQTPQANIGAGLNPEENPFMDYAATGFGSGFAEGGF